MSRLNADDFPFCVTPVTSETFVDNDGMYPWALSKADAMEWFWRIRQWTIGFGVSTSGGSTSTSFLSKDLTSDSNEKARVCSYAGLVYPLNIDSWEGVTTNAQGKFVICASTYQPDLWTPVAVPAQIYKLANGLFRPMIAWDLRVFKEGAFDEQRVFSLYAVASAYAASIASSVVTLTANLFNRTMNAYAVKIPPTITPSWTINFQPQSWYPFGHEDGSLPVLNTSNGAVLNDPFGP